MESELIAATRLCDRAPQPGTCRHRHTDERHQERAAGVRVQTCLSHASFVVIHEGESRSVNGIVIGRGFRFIRSLTVTVVPYSGAHSYGRLSRVSGHDKQSALQWPPCVAGPAVRRTFVSPGPLRSDSNRHLSDGQRDVDNAHSPADIPVRRRRAAGECGVTSVMGESNRC
jgi:hypothetical protein